MAYGDFKDLTRRAASVKTSGDKAFNVAKNPKYDEYQRGLASMVYKIFDKNFFYEFKVRGLTIEDLSYASYAK